MANERILSFTIRFCPKPPLAVSLSLSRREQHAASKLTAGGKDGIFFDNLHPSMGENKRFKS
jgi:hypothetical protein